MDMEITVDLVSHMSLDGPFESAIHIMVHGLTLNPASATPHGFWEHPVGFLLARRVAALLAEAQGKLQHFHLRLTLPLETKLPLQGDIGF